ncbi:hypothetical protein Tco_1095395, partial [Tanacetum coccineum]
KKNNSTREDAYSHANADQIGFLTERDEDYNKYTWNSTLNSIELQKKTELNGATEEREANGGMDVISAEDLSFEEVKGTNLSFRQRINKKKEDESKDYMSQQRCLEMKKTDGERIAIQMFDKMSLSFRIEGWTAKDHKLEVYESVRALFGIGHWIYIGY